jgi:predicted transcriptional regulator
MSTTTIRLPDELRARIEKLAAARGSSAHSFMVEAVARAAEQEERQLDFAAEAERRLRHMARTGEYLTLDDLRPYALALARGEKPARPQVRKMTAAELQRFRASLRRSG